LSHVCSLSLSRQDTVSLALGGGTTTSVSSPGDGVRSSVPANSAFGAAKFAADAAAAAAAEAVAKQNKSSGSFYAWVVRYLPLIISKYEFHLPYAHSYRSPSREIAMRLCCGGGNAEEIGSIIGSSCKKEEWAQALFFCFLIPDISRCVRISRQSVVFVFDSRLLMNAGASKLCELLLPLKRRIETRRCYTRRLQLFWQGNQLFHTVSTRIVIGLWLAKRYSSAAGEVWSGAMKAVMTSIETFSEGQRLGCEVRQLGYLRCCLAFLNGNAKNVLSDNAVQLSHRLAFAAHYLPDEDLVRFFWSPWPVSCCDSWTGKVFVEGQRLGCEVWQLDGTFDHRTYSSWRGIDWELCEA
jgi:hypothetical protein